MAERDGPSQTQKLELRDWASAKKSTQNISSVQEHESQKEKKTRPQHIRFDASKRAFFFWASLSQIHTVVP